jgi:choline dehydrogenase-like flavoprotein
MEHARDFSLVLVPESPEFFARAGFYDLRRSDDGFLVGGRLTLTDDALDRFQLPSCSLTLVPRRRAQRPRLVRRPLRRASRYGWSAVRSPDRAFDRFDVIVNLEQRPDPRNRIELSSRRDRFGNPLPRLLLEWTDDEQERLERLRRLLGKWFREAGLGQLVISAGHRPDLSAHHHAGTTRMGIRPEEGVVDPDGRVFGTENLYLVGSSVFPSAGFANPTLTIVALGRRLARHIAAR